MTKLPREDSQRVQEILNNDKISLDEKAKRIYMYDNSCLSREYDRKKPKPEMSEYDIFVVLMERAGKTP